MLDHPRDPSDRLLVDPNGGCSLSVRSIQTRQLNVVEATSSISSSACLRACLPAVNIQEIESVVHSSIRQVRPSMSQLDWRTIRVVVKTHPLPRAYSLRFY